MEIILINIYCKKQTLRTRPICYVTLIFSFLAGCSYNPVEQLMPGLSAGKELTSTAQFDPKSWAWFLQHLPVVNAPVLNYRGQPIANQGKQAGVVNYDVGQGDLQQCADAMIRLRAEYLFRQKKYEEIGFHFVSGHFYSWKDYCTGRRPVVSGSNVRFINTISCAYTHATLRRYLDIVYAYAGTLSIGARLKPATVFAVGVIIIHPGSPGHCCIIVDEALDENGKKVFKLVEGYTPAQSIYVVRNIWEPAISPWYHLDKTEIKTSSYIFRNYKMCKFE